MRTRMHKRNCCDRMGPAYPVTWRNVAGSAVPVTAEAVDHGELVVAGAP